MTFQTTIRSRKEGPDVEETQIRDAFVHRSFEERLAAFDGNIEVEAFDWGESKGKEKRI